MAGKYFYIFINGNDNIAVALAEKTGGLLRLNLIYDYIFGSGVQEIVQISGFPAAVLLCEVAFLCRLFQGSLSRLESKRAVQESCCCLDIAVSRGFGRRCWFDCGFRLVLRRKTRIHFL